MTTLKDIAKASGYSVCTVSRALSGKGSMKTETKEKILKLVDEMGFKPNKSAVSLKTGRTNTIALIIPDVTNSYYPSLEKYISRYASRKGFMVYLCNADNHLELEKQYINSIISNQVNGVIIVTSSKEHSHVQKLAKYGIPYVYLNRTYDDDLNNCIRTNNHKAAYEIFNYLLDCGHEKIGCLFRSFKNMVYEERYNGIIQAMEERNIDPQSISMLYDLNDDEKCCATLTALLKKPDHPKAFFAANDMLALDVYKAAYNAGLRIPDDISVTGYDDIPVADRLFPPLTTYLLPAKEMCRIAVDTIVKRIEGKEPTYSPILEGKIIKRDSVRKIND